MRWFKRKRLNVWEYEPYAFEPGKVYVIEVNLAGISGESIEHLEQYFKKHKITVELVPTAGNLRVLNLVESKKIRQVSKSNREAVELAYDRQRLRSDINNRKGNHQHGNH